jgi:hypothetical protein
LTRFRITDRVGVSTQGGLIEEGDTMSETTVYLSDLTLGYLMAIVEGATTVPGQLLLENPEFVKSYKTLETLEELTDWVNENY